MGCAEDRLGIVSGKRGAEENKEDGDDRCSEERCESEREESRL